MRSAALLIAGLALGCGDASTPGDISLATDDLTDTTETDDLTMVPPGADLSVPANSDLAQTQTAADLSSVLQFDLAVSLPFTSSVSVYIEPDSGITPVLNAIKSAKKSIAVEMYLLTDSQLINALSSAQSKINVQVILEQKPNQGSNASACSAVNCKYGNPAYMFTHQKSMIIDGTTLWAMTMNFSSAAVNGNREYLVVDTDPTDVAEAQAVFDADWNRTTTPALTDLAVSPTTARAKIDQLINTATQTIEIEWEELSDNDVASHLAQRIKAGVAVHIIAPTSISGTATATTLSALKLTGATVKLLSSPTPHAKMILVDRTRGFIGSENGTANSLDQNRELGVLWENATVASDVGSTFDSDWSAATPY